MRIAALIIALVSTVAARGNPDYVPTPQPKTARQEAADFSISAASSEDCEDGYTRRRDMIIHAVKTHGAAGVQPLLVKIGPQKFESYAHISLNECTTPEAFADLLALFKAHGVDTEKYMRYASGAAVYLGVREYMPLVYAHAESVGVAAEQVDKEAAWRSLEPHIRSFNHGNAFRALVEMRGRTPGIDAGVRKSAKDRWYNNDVDGTTAILEYIMPAIESFGDVAGSLVANAAFLGEVHQLVYVLDRIHFHYALAAAGINRALRLSVPSRFNYPDDGACLAVLLARFGNDPAFIARGLRGALYAAARKHNLAALGDIVAVLARGDRSLGGKAVELVASYAEMAGNDLIRAAIAPLLR